MERNPFPIVMRSAAALTTVGFLGLTAWHLSLPHPHVLTGAITFGTTAYHFLMRLAVGWMVPKATRYDFDYRSAWFRPRAWEAAFYRKLRVRSWKGKLPTYAPGQFSLADNTLYRVIQNTCGAELVHEIIMLFSFLPLLLVPVFGEFPVFFTTSLVSTLFDGVFVIAQRYNRPRLVRIFEKQEAKRP